MSLFIVAAMSRTGQRGQDLGEEHGRAPDVGLLGWDAAKDRDRHTPVTYGHKRALNEINSFFDSLPTDGCDTPDCIARSRRAKVARHPRRPRLTPAQLRRAERTLLGYHRRAEAAITAKEIKGYGSEASKIVASSDRGYAALEHPAVKSPSRPLPFVHPRRSRLRHLHDQRETPGARGRTQDRRSGRDEDRGGRGGRSGSGSRSGNQWRDAQPVSKTDRLGLPAVADIHSKAYDAERRKMHDPGYYDNVFADASSPSNSGGAGAGSHDASVRAEGNLGTERGRGHGRRSEAGRKRGMRSGAREEERGEGGTLDGVSMEKLRREEMAVKLANAKVAELQRANRRLSSVNRALANSVSAGAAHLLLPVRQGAVGGGGGGGRSGVRGRRRRTSRTIENSIRSRCVCACVRCVCVRVCWLLRACMRMCRGVVLPTRTRATAR